MTDTDELKAISVSVSLTGEQAEDWDRMERIRDCMFFDFGRLSLTGEPEPFTEEEQRTGYRIRMHDDHEHKYAVLWRAEEERKAADAKRKAEMAACPYVECTCGHHEDV